MARSLKLGAQAAAVVLVAALLALLVWKMVHQQGGGAAAALARGEKPAAPSFTLPRLDRPGRLSLVSLRGKVVVLAFWGSWCYACREETRHLEAVWQRYRQRGVVVLGVDFWDLRGDARRFLRRFGGTFPNVYDGPGSLIDPYAVTGAPETWFVDRTGRLVGEQLVGVATEEELARNIEAALRS